VIGFQPFYTSQNVAGKYPIMVSAFFCKVQGKKVIRSNESENIHWVSMTDLKEKLRDTPDKFYPMHISLLRLYVDMNTGTSV